jgi:hypothetical protein
MSTSKTTSTPATAAAATDSVGREGGFRTFYRTNNRGGFQHRGGFQRRNDNADGGRPRYNNNRLSRPVTNPEEKKQYPTEPNFAVTRNGALALYNVMRRPIVFYANQWEGIRTMIENGSLATVLTANADKLRRPKTEDETTSSADVEAGDQ